jgi:membrane associated rhomboid family serine protease
MLSERDYSTGDYRPGTSMTVKLIIVLTVIFAFQAINAAYLGRPFEQYLALTPDALRGGRVWQLVTFQLLHGGFLHLVINALMLWMFGRFAEGAFGGWRMLRIWILGGVAGGLLQALLGLVAPKLGGFAVGASAGVCALLAIFCALEPDQEVRLYLVIPLRARHLLYLSVGVALFFTLVPVGDGVAHAAHLGGLLFGWGYVRYGFHREYGGPEFSGGAALAKLSRWFRPKPKRPEGRVIPAKFETTRVEPPAEALDDAEFIAREVDPILDKIAQHGLQSLTARERRILEAARAKVTKK